MNKTRKTLYYVAPIFLFLITIAIAGWTNINHTLDEKATIKPDTVSEIAIQKPILSKEIFNVYEAIGLHQTGLAFSVFEKALTGFINIKKENHLNKSKEILTVIDFSKLSTEKRMWIIDLKNKSILLNTYVAHGKGSGDNTANKFSNIAESHQSSLGFYITNEIYQGKHGLSLKLDGLDQGINNMARNRAIVIHGAPYVSENFINSHGRLGRSFGCPAVPVELNKTIINLIKDKTCLFISGPANDYKSVFLNKEKAEENLTNI